MRMIRLVAVPVAIAIAILGACGGDQPDLSTSASAVLQERVAEIRTLAEAREADAVIAKVDELRSLVEQLRDDGEISADAAERILASVAAVSENVATITTTTTTTAPPDEDEDEDDDEDKDEGENDEEDKGKGKDRGKGEGKGDD